MTAPSSLQQQQQQQPMSTPINSDMKLNDAYNYSTKSNITRSDSLPTNTNKNKLLVCNDSNYNNNTRGNLDIIKNYSMTHLISNNSQQQQSMDFNDISSFGTLNTLATIAAQSPHLNNQDLQFTAANTQSKVNFEVRVV
jgi:hypothetical protein